MSKRTTMMLVTAVLSIALAVICGISCVLLKINTDASIDVDSPYRIAMIAKAICCVILAMSGIAAASLSSRAASARRSHVETMGLAGGILTVVSIATIILILVSGGASTSPPSLLFAFCAFCSSVSLYIGTRGIARYGNKKIRPE